MWARRDMLAIIIKRHKDLDGRAVNLFYSGQLKRIGTDGWFDSRFVKYI